MLLCMMGMYLCKYVLKISSISSVMDLGHNNNAASQKEDAI